MRLSVQSGSSAIQRSTLRSLAQDKKKLAGEGHMYPPPPGHLVVKHWLNETFFECRHSAKLHIPGIIHLAQLAQHSIDLIPSLLQRPFFCICYCVTSSIEVQQSAVKSALPQVRVEYYWTTMSNGLTASMFKASTDLQLSTFFASGSASTTRLLKLCTYEIRSLLQTPSFFIYWSTTTVSG